MEEVTTMNGESQEKIPRLATAIIYGTGILQGLAMVSFPASATVLKEVKGFTDAQYGLIFIPQIIAAIIGSLSGGGLARSWGLKKLLFITLIATALSQVGLLTARQKDGRCAVFLPSSPSPRIAAARCPRRATRSSSRN